MRLFKKILVANRGEIAVRVIRACKELDIPTVAVYSDADMHSIHKEQADEAVLLGAAESSQSYLNMEKIINAARKAKADAIHPGYGFLSQNPDFSRMCRSNNICFIGATPENLEKTGLKLEAKKMARKAGIPVVPGTEHDIHKVEEAIEVAERIGFPVLIKASAGGGGKGMRIVRNRDEFSDCLEKAKKESMESFSSDKVFIEKYMENPRHIEVQVMGDGKGNVIHFYERECSIQRKYQKLIEEAPCSILEDAEREKVCSYAVRLAESIGYLGAGTVEFVMDSAKKFHFIEMNTRIQVEHGITELITGIDIVKEQIKVAATGKLSYNQGDINHRGHAIECRICAESPARNFIPSEGRIVVYQPPVGKDVRLDTGVKQGTIVTPFYDSLLAKLISWGQDRQEAIKRMQIFLDSFEISGVDTTIPLFKLIMKDEAYRNNAISTHFLQKGIIDLLSDTDDRSLLRDYALAAVFFAENIDVAKEEDVPKWVTMTGVR